MPAYMIFQEKFHDRQLFETYRQRVMATLEPFQARFLARGGAQTILEGSWPFERTVIIEFPSRADAESWYRSEAYQKILPIRLESMDCNAIVVDGVN